MEADSGGSLNADSSQVANSAVTPKAEEFKMPSVPMLKKAKPSLPDDTVSSSNTAPLGECPAKYSEANSEAAAAAERPSSSSDAAVRAPADEDPEKRSRTIFVSNLDFKLPADRLRAIFHPIGEITDIRLASRGGRAGWSKGFGYVEFASLTSVPLALKLDRMPVDGRPMFVSVCKPEKESRGPALHFATGLEKNKLFVRGLPKDATQAQLVAHFQPYGVLKETRIVTHRDGKSKGVAYVEFQDEASAAKALHETDGKDFRGKALDIAYSNPPAPRKPGQGPAPFGAMKAPSGDRKARVGFLPRAVAKPAAPPPPMEDGVKEGTTAVKEPAKVEVEEVTKPDDLASNAQMSNEAFRQMFMKK